MTDLRKAAQQALEALKKSHPYSNSGRDLDNHSEAIHAIRAALAQPEQEAAAEREACIALLKGIDQTESESDDGWWETSTGAKFGAGVLASIRARGAATRQTLISDFHSACAGIGLSPNEVERIRCSLAQPEPEPVEQLKRIHPLDIPLDVFVEDLSTRPRNIINAEMRYFTHSGDEYMKPPFTVRHLLMFSRKELRKWPNLGKRSLNEIEEMLRNRGLQLWEEHDERSLSLLRIHPTYYSSPPQRQPLTEEEIENLGPLSFTWRDMVQFARAIEAAHGIGEWWPVFQRAAADSEGGEV